MNLFCFGLVIVSVSASLAGSAVAQGRDSKFRTSCCFGELRFPSACLAQSRLVMEKEALLADETRETVRAGFRLHPMTVWRRVWDGA